MALGASAASLTPYIAIAMNGDLKASEGSYVNSESPLGIFGANIETEYATIGYRHISSIPQVDETQGINEVLGTLQYKGLYTGIAYNNPTTTSSYYTKQLSKYSRLLGYKLDYGDRYIFIEYRDSSKKDMLIYGVGFTFDSSKL